MTQATIIWNVSIPATVIVSQRDTTKMQKKRHDMYRSIEKVLRIEQKEGKDNL